MYRILEGAIDKSQVKKGGCHLHIFWGQVEDCLLSSDCDKDALSAVELHPGKADQGVLLECLYHYFRYTKGSKSLGMILCPTLLNAFSMSKLTSWRGFCLLLASSMR